MLWDCRIPGKEGSIWEGGVYKVVFAFDACLLLLCFYKSLTLHFGNSRFCCNLQIDIPSPRRLHTLSPFCFIQMFLIMEVCACLFLTSTRTGNPQFPFAIFSLDCKFYSTRPTFFRLPKESLPNFTKRIEGNTKEELESRRPE